MKTKLVPFDLEKAKAGAKVVTRCGYPVRIDFYDVKNEIYPILAIVQDGESEFPYRFTINGKYHKSENIDSSYDLFIEEEVENDSKNQDEAIRKALISYFQSFPFNSLEDAGINAKDAIAWLEKQGEQNSLEIIPDKWYVCTHHISSDDAEIWFKKDSKYMYDILKCKLDLHEDDSYQNYFCPWNIQDAKDGDVLVCIGKYGQEIGIVKKYVGKYGGCDKCFETYCFVDWEGRFRLGEYMGSKEIYPATKEQCDFLFQKMKEAGYEWNSDKKELHKIEEVKKRRMTHQELSWWLRDCPEEHREYGFCDDEGVRYSHTYRKDSADKEVEKEYRIRRNGGEWEEPLIEE